MCFNTCYQTQPAGRRRQFHLLLLSVPPSHTVFPRILCDRGLAQYSLINCYLKVPRINTGLNEQIWTDEKKDTKVHHFDAFSEIEQWRYRRLVFNFENNQG